MRRVIPFSGPSGCWSVGTQREWGVLASWRVLWAGAGGGVSKNVIFVIFVSWSLLPGSEHQREDVGPLWL